MISKPPHRIIGVKLITMDDQELEPAADVEPQKHCRL